MPKWLKYTLVIGVGLIAIVAGITLIVASHGAAVPALAAVAGAIGSKAAFGIGITTLVCGILGPTALVTDMCNEGIAQNRELEEQIRGSEQEADDMERQQERLNEIDTLSKIDLSKEKDLDKNNESLLLQVTEIGYDYRNQLERLKKQNTENFKELKDDYDKLTKEKDKLSTNNKNSLKNNTSLTQTNEELEMQNHTLQEKNKQLNESEQKLHKKCRKSDAEIESKNKCIATLMDNLEAKSKIKNNNVATKPINNRQSSSQYSIFSSRSVTPSDESTETELQPKH